ncbi:hypothetical protein [Solirubrobacter soli]|uniref:hypothetical protein n=1 Tax=Solirubrobacter soli TaxID=363832 RepID=UPI00040C3837|nr:hypothetical protein [Solirubrobacter soli]
MPDVDHLYALPLEEFTPARDAAAKEIRKAGDRETAAIVAKLPKPTPAAWTANQVAREQPDLIDAMLAAGEELRIAQEAAVSGGGAAGLRDATQAERRAVEAVMTAATAFKPAGKPLSRAMADRLRTTLHAAAGDEAIREALAEGRLVDEAQAGGAWPFALDPTPREERGAKKRAPAKRGEEAGGEGAGGAATKRGGRAAKSGEEAGGAGAGGAATKRGGRAAKGGEEAGGAAAKGTDDAGGAATKRGAANGDEAAAAAERERKAAEAREAAEREAAEREARKALEGELREARTALRVRERVFKGAEEDATAAHDGVGQAKAALEQAQKAVEDAIAEAEAADHVRDHARDALDQARDTVARLEERLD